MPKIRDLAISTIPRARPAMYAFYGEKECKPAKSAPPPEPCNPTPPKCHPSQPQCEGGGASRPPDERKKEEKYVRGLPAHAVIELREQLQRQIRP